MKQPWETETEAVATERALATLAQLPEAVVRWVPRVRPADGARGRFQWAVQTTRGANVAATAYLLGAFPKMGIYDRVITAEDQAAGIAWGQAMHRGNQQYYDPALLDQRNADWPADKPWPEPAMQVGVNQYAQSVLRGYGVTTADLPPAPPPAGWPQPTDTPQQMLDWIRARPWATGVWGAGSHAMRMTTWMLQWHKEGRLPLEPVVEALRFFYSIQDPETGLWGTAKLPQYDRINGTFKLFPLMREALDLPLPWASKIIDQVIAEFARPDYDAHVGACDEWDNWYVIALAREQAPGYREKELRRLAAWRIARIGAVFSAPDGGLSYAPGHCCGNWIGFTVAPSIEQGDAMAPGILAGGVSVCVDLLGWHGRSGWTGQWRMRPREAPELRAEIVRRLRASGALPLC